MKKLGSPYLCTTLAVVPTLLAMPVCAASCARTAVSTAQGSPEQPPTIASQSPQRSSDLLGVKPEQTEKTTQPSPPDARPNPSSNEEKPQNGSTAEASTPQADEDELDQLRQLAQTRLLELLAVYRRLHIELDDAGRSALIVELLKDPRNEVRLLGYELADRDLSSNTVLSPEVGETVKQMITDPAPLIRAKAARLLTRLVPPDAMIVLTESLSNEDHPTAAEPMLTGIARWPNADAAPAVMSWCLRDDAPFTAACNAAWAFEQAGLWDPQTDHPRIMQRLREAEPKQLRESAMKLIAKFGEARDIRVLVDLMLSGPPNAQQWAASALVETPRAVEILVQAAEENPALFAAASDALIRHRSTPEGLRRLVSLPAADEQAKAQAVLRMGERIEIERLAEAVKLAELAPDQSITLLNRLLTNSPSLSPRVARGVILLAELELSGQRPNRALEAAIALDKATLDPADRARADSLKAASLILLGRFADAAELTNAASDWIAVINSTPDAELRKRIGSYVLASLSQNYSPEQVEQVRQASGLAP